MREDFKREAFRVALIFCAIAVALAVTLQPTSDRGRSKAEVAEFPEVTLAEAYYLFKRQSAVFVDVRSEQEFARGHIPGALAIRSADPEPRIPPTPPTVVIYGARGVDGSVSAVARALRAKGAQNVHILTAGWLDWRMLNLPSEGET